MAEKTLKAASSSDIRIFDVSKPGKSMVAATRRPVIVTNRPIMQDPMMSASISDIAAAAISGVAPKITIKPLSEIAKKDADDKQLVAAASENISTEESSSKTADNDESSSAAPIGDTESSKSPDTSDTKDDKRKAAPPEPVRKLPDTPADVVPELDGTKEQKETAALEAAAKKGEEIDNIIDSKEYFLPINTIERRRSKVVTILGLILIVLLGLLLVNLLLDLGALRINGVEPLTRFFSA